MEPDRRNAIRLLTRGAASQKDADLRRLTTLPGGWRASFRATPTTTPCRRTSSPSRRSARRRFDSGIGRSRAAARKGACRGSAWSATAIAGSHPPESCTPGPKSGSTFVPKAGAQCVSSARWDLRGGRPEPNWPNGLTGEGPSLPQTVKRPGRQLLWPLFRCPPMAGFGCPPRNGSGFSCNRQR